MLLYRAMQRLKWPASYVGKILLICFAGTHVPLLALSIWALTGPDSSVTLVHLAVVLGATLVGTAATLSALHAMLRPVVHAERALTAYTSEGVAPNLPTEFHDEAGRLMASVQSTIARLDERVDEVTRIAMTDELTGARNRRWLHDIGIPLMEARQRRNTLWSLLVIDLDDFKSVNDTFGHSVGDKVLMTAADAIREAVRDCDHVIRMGGDEFCVLLPGADASDVAEIASRVRSEIDSAMSQLPKEQGVTISVGGATARRKDNLFAEIFRRADRHLYDVKSSGRNAFISG